MSYEAIIYEAGEGILTITLNRPDKLNAATDALLSELLDAFKRAKKDDSIRVVILTGAGRGFCAGQDLGQAQQNAEGEEGLSFGKHLRDTYHPVIMAMTQFPKPIIGAINGVAAGAGMSLALACDLRIAAGSARFIQSFIKIGLVPDSGSTWMLPRLIGRARAMELMMTGRQIDAQQAFAWGLVNQVVKDDDLMESAQQWAAEFAKAPTKAIGYLKRSLEYAIENDLKSALDYEADMQELAGKTADFKEGVTAFLEKRTPKFNGE